MSLTRRWGALLITALLGVMLLGAGVAQAASYPPTQGAATTSSTVVTPGQSLTVSGGGFAPNTSVSVDFNSMHLATVTSNSSGVATATVMIPSSTPPGSYTITLTGLSVTGATHVDSVAITVVAPAAATTTSTLPFTGAEILQYGLLALALVLAGVALLVVTRRRRHSGEGAA